MLSLPVRPFFHLLNQGLLEAVTHVRINHCRPYGVSAELTRKHYLSCGKLEGPSVINLLSVSHIVLHSSQYRHQHLGLLQVL